MPNAPRCPWCRALVGSTPTCLLCIAERMVEHNQVLHQHIEAMQKIVETMK